jgi:NADH dehydrogenase
LRDHLKEGPARILVLGGGFGGAYLAKALERRVSPHLARVELVDRRNFFVFTPLLVEAGTGSVEPRHTVVSLRSFLGRSGFRMGEVEAVDPDRRRARFRPASADTAGAGPAAEELPYDHLVLALGSVTRLPPVPGLAERGWELKSLGDAVALRDRAIRLLEQADGTEDPELRRELLHFVVVGANFTGVEVAGEFLDFLRAASRSYPRVGRDECAVTVVEREARVLGALDPGLAERGRRQLERLGVRFLLNESAREIREREIVLASGPALPTRTVVWCAGIAPPPLLGTMGLPLDERGYLLCDPTLRVRGRPDVWAIGDCAVTTDPDGRPHPATAQQAVREGARLAANLARVLAGREPRPLAYRTAGSLAALGSRRGVGVVFGIPVSGWFAWWLWRTVYLWKMPGVGRRLRVALDWTLASLFRRDYVQLGIHGPTRRR